MAIDKKLSDLHVLLADDLTKKIKSYDVSKNPSTCYCK